MSKTYKCRDCKEYFDKPRIYVDYVPYGSTSVPMESATCPHCGSSDFDEAYEVEREEEEEEEEEKEE